METKVFRFFTEKKPGFDVEARALKEDLTGFLGIACEELRLFNRYDIQGVSEAHKRAVADTVLSEPMSDNCFEDELPALPEGARILCIEPLPGQFDLRASSCEQCVQFLLGGSRPVVRAARIIAMTGADAAAFESAKAYLINPVESCEGSMDKPLTLARDFAVPDDISSLDGFTGLDPAGLSGLMKGLGLAMDIPDLECLQEYFKGEGRQPTLTELRVVDTYWSDHCRHTTFQTIINDADIRDRRARKAWDRFVAVNSGRPATLMNLATAAMRHLRDTGRLPALDVSDENNACTVRVKADIAGRDEDWLLFFKNETHNHPTEIEPFGGAATCIGGAIRDPLSGRAYVYQAMRVTGAGDPRRPLEDTLPGKLPQRKLTTAAAAGYSSYGNQIGLATGFVKEIYHEGYVAKRMEVGAVVGAARAEHVRREVPAPGDAIILLGGHTGRDGIGGATGSSKTHDETSVAECAAEVQKGNAPEERKLQRLFRKREVSRLIKRCNDFGAGGVAVAVGELAPGLVIDLDKVPKKYNGLDGTEIAISESQERMAVVVAPGDADSFMREAALEDLEATVIAVVTADERLVMTWRGRTVVSIDRAFLDSAGAEKHTSVSINKPQKTLSRPWDNKNLTVSERLLLLASDLNFCSQRGLTERFDGSIGAGSVLMQHGGPNRQSPAQVMAALIPARGGKTASLMSYAFDPYISEADQFGGAVNAVVTSLSKLVAAGCSVSDAYLTLQEYFPRPGTDPVRWGRPAAAVLGAFRAQIGLGVAAIGGKDSMSGSFESLDVPPTLISFAVATEPAGQVLSPDLKDAGHTLCLFEAPVGADGMPDYAGLRSMWEGFYAHVRQGRVLSAYAAETGGAPGALAHMSLSGIGACVDPKYYSDSLWNVPWGSIIAESVSPLDGARVIGCTQSAPELRLGSDFIPLASLEAAWSGPLEGVFPTSANAGRADGPALAHTVRALPSAHKLSARPRAVIPVFPGTNCELDTAAALERAGAEPEIVLVRNSKPEWLAQSLLELEAAFERAQMIVIPGGFSGGDEPDGSGKFIVSLFKNPRLTDAVRDLLHRRGGLMLGICNGFQALVKLGLVPFGDIRDMDCGCPTLTYNTIGRHQALYVNTRVSSVLSPWLSKCSVGDVHAVPVSHGEGRFVCPPALLDRLVRNGQIAFQYCGADGIPSMATGINPNGSVLCAEGVTSPDGRVLGKMAHSERAGRFVGMNISGEKLQPLFEGGVEYFK